MSSSDTFPLVTLQAVSDFNNAWVALLLEADAPLDSRALAHLLNDHALREVLDSVACVAEVDPLRIDPALAADLPAHRLILRFPVALGADPAHHATLAALHQAGFGLMATGFPAAGAPLCAEIASLAVACPGHNMPAGFGDWLRKLPGPHLALGTTEHVCPGFCKFHWLAGHLAGHASMTPQGDPTTRSLLLKLLGLVTSDADSTVLEAVIKRDTNLSYHLLKLVNSVAFSHTRRIDNFNQAITLLGRRQLQRWLQLLLYSRAQGSGGASQLLPRAALRASLMEELAKRLHLAREMQDHAFIAGMFSLLDTLFGLPLAELIEPLNLPEEIVAALTRGAADGRGQLGDLLAAAIAGEGPPGAMLANALAVAGIGREEWAGSLITAMRWAVQVSREA